jgi:ATP-binding cassette subfamily C protein
LLSKSDFRKGRAELRQARGKGTGLYLVVFGFSFFVNLLMLTGPLYMLQVYDRVLGSRSEETLIALSLLVLFLFVAMAFLDHARGRILARAAAAFQDALDRRVFQAAVRRLTLVPNDALATPAQRDLEAVRSFMGSPVLTAFFDLPWTPLFLTAIFIFHPLLGWVSIGGGIALICVTLLNRSMSRGPLLRANSATMQADIIADSLKSESEIVQALGMERAGFARWQKARGAALQSTMEAGDLSGAFTVSSRTFRLFLQSAMLGLGAWLALRGELSPGAMIAGSILLGRALAPVELLVGQWALVQRSQEGWGRLSALLTLQPAPEDRTALPRPTATIDVQQLTVVPPGETLPVLRGVSFKICNCPACLAALVAEFNIQPRRISAIN